MAWIREHSWTFIVLAAIVLSFVIGRIDVADRAHDAKVDDVASCVRANTRSALDAASDRFTGAFVRRQGLPALANGFGEYAHGSASYLAIAKYMDDPENATRVHTIRINGEDAKVLTDKSSNLIIEGCARAFHATEDETPDEYPSLGIQP